MLIRQPKRRPTEQSLHEGYLFSEKPFTSQDLKQGTFEKPLKKKEEMLDEIEDHKRGCPECDMGNESKCGTLGKLLNELKRIEDKEKSAS
jgi:hypothetical protein